MRILIVGGAGEAFVTMADLGRAIASMISTPTASSQVYNVGSLYLTWEEI